QTKRIRSGVGGAIPTILWRPGADAPGPGTLIYTPYRRMNIERLLREVDKRLAHLAETDRAEAVDAVREEIARERRRVDPHTTMERERERRAEAETLREILEAINRQASLDQTMDEVLKQLARIVVFDSCSLGLLDADGSFRILASRGFADPAHVKGFTFQSPLSEALRHGRSALSLNDVTADERFVRVEGAELIRSWAGIPLLVEGDVIGVLCLDRHNVEPFDDEDLHRAKAVAFSAAAAIRKAQLLEKVRRYAALMERVVQVDEAVFAGRPPVELARVILEGALRIGAYAGGAMVIENEGDPSVVAASDGLASGGRVPPDLLTRATRRLPPEPGAASEARLGLGGQGMFLVPLATPDVHVGTLVLADPNGESVDDNLMESYASRAAAAWVHAVRPGRSAS
ncbi:MAG TPA: GAF domain-containing protein, partial [Vicinamibacteria bacterium]|nr:GAF domain-containing protein [Vicinamibacteria bacterium]